MDALNALMLQIDWGADEALEERPLDRRAVPPPLEAQPVPPPRPAAPTAATPLARAQALAEGAADRAVLLAALETFDGCALRATATSLVFAEGNPDSGLVLVADVPGAAEDRAGIPFANPFLDRMLASIRLDRSHVFMTSLVPWRPPGDRKPTETEVQLCLPFLLRHLALLRPQRVVLFGALAGRTLLPSSGRRRRGVWHALTAPGLTPLPALALAALSHIQATPAAKRDAWADLLLLRRALDADSSPDN
ncbi:MAG: uracil-DNA glycosylase [Acetobacteraceae bacterium]